MSRSLNRPRSLVFFAVVGFVASSVACQKTDHASAPDTATQGDPPSTGGLGHGGNPGGGGSGGILVADGPSTSASSGDARGEDGTGDVGSDAAPADDATSGVDRSRLDGGSPDAYANEDLLPRPDLLVSQDAQLPFWTGQFVANCTPAPINGRQQLDGHHHAGEDCMRSGCHRDPELAAHHEGTDCRGSGCHADGSPDGSGAPAFLFGGTIYRATTLIGAPAIEVAVRATEGFFSTCSASNGNFWRLAPSRTAPPLTWTSAAAGARDLDGETIITTSSGAGCNDGRCHGENRRLTSP